MIKKRYLMVLSFVVVSVLLGSLLYNRIAQAGKPVPPPEPVEVTNFPLDDQGNLRVTQMEGEQHVIVTNWPAEYEVQHFSDINISWTGGTGSVVLPALFAFNYVGGYSRMSILIDLPSSMSTGSYDLTIWLSQIGWSVYGVRSYVADYPASDFFNATIHRDSWGWGWIPPYPSSAVIETRAPYYALAFEVSSTVPSGWAKLSFHVYLRNE